MQQDIDVENVCFLALSRPAMFLGVPQIGLMLNLSGSVIVSGWLGVGSWHILIWLFVLAPAVHLVMREGIRRDYNFFRILTLGAQTKNQGTKYWGGSTLAPLPGWPDRAGQWEQM